MYRIILLCYDRKEQVYSDGMSVCAVRRKGECTLSELERKAMNESAQQAAPRRRRADRYMQQTEAPAAEPAAKAPVPVDFQTRTPEPTRPLNPDLAPLHAPSDWNSGENAADVDRPRQAAFAPLDLGVSSAETPRPRSTDSKLDFTPTRRPGPVRKVSLDDTSYPTAVQSSEALQSHVPVEETYQSTDSDRPRRGWLIALIIVLLLIALLVGGYFLIPSNAGGLLGQYRSLVNRFLPASAPVPATETVPASVPAEVLGFNGAPVTGRAPSMVNFSVTTSTTVEDVRLISDSGETQSANIVLVASDDTSRSWLITLPIPEPMKANVTVQYHNGEAWISYDQYLNLVFE